LEAEEDQMKTNDKVVVSDFGSIKTSSGVERFWGDLSNESIIGVTGWVKMVMRERGKIVPGSHRDGKNTWTNTGREFLAMVMSLNDPATSLVTKARTDSITYIGMGSGTNPTSSAGITSLVVPIAFQPGDFLAQLDIPTYPLAPSRTTVRYHRTFTESQITTVPGSTVNVSEMGLFTNGDPSQNNAANTRVITMAASGSAAPCAYKTFDPLAKTDTMQIDVAWEIRF
jgi:hypothetical protein